MGNSETGYQKQLFLNGALILSLAAIITKILSAIYRIPYQNIVGDVGFYIYQQVYPFFGIALALATTGFPVIISKVYAEMTHKGKENDTHKLLLTAFTGIFIFCLIVFLVLFFGAGTIASLMGDPNLSGLIQIISFTFLLVPLTSVIRGYFQGQSNMKPTAISQVSEQTIRVSLIIALAVILTTQGHSLYAVGESAMLASVIGAGVGTLILAAIALKQKKTPFHFPLRSFFANISIIRGVLIQGIAICISGLTLVLFQLSDAFQIYNGLLDQPNFTEETAKAVKGIFDRGQPILQFGMILAMSLALTIVPAIISVKDNEKELAEYIRLSLKISLAIGAASSVGLLLIAESLNIMLFNNSLGTSVLQVLFLAVFFASINATIIAILQGLDYTIFPAFIVLFGLAIKVVFNEMLIDWYGIVGAAISTNAALIFILILLRRKLRIVVGGRILNKGFFGNLMFSLGVMSMVLFAFFILFGYISGDADKTRLIASIEAVGAVLVGGSVFIFTSVKKGLFTREELKHVPFGGKLLKWVK